MDPSPTSGHNDQASDPTSPTLLLGLRNDDGDAWKRLVRIYGPLLVSWCRRCQMKEADAFDISQEVLMGVNQSLDRFEHRRPDDAGRGGFRAWLWTITRNKIADYRRQAIGRAQAGGGTGALMEILSLPDQSPETSEDIADLHLRALAEIQMEFNESTWTAFWRVAVEGDAAKDVAEDMGISVWAIYKAKSRIMAKLRDHFGEEFS